MTKNKENNVEYKKYFLKKIIGAIYLIAQKDRG
jgi:hypothetical protein